MADRFVTFPGVPGWLVRPVRRAREKYRWFDTMLRAAVRFDEVHAGRLAAAMSYHAFLAVFPLLLLSFSVLGYVLKDDAALTLRVESFLRENLPGLPVSAIADARNTAGVLGVLGFLYTGLRWVDVVRSSVRAVWRRDQTPGNILTRSAKDLLAMVGLGAALLLSVGLSTALSTGASRLLNLIGQDGHAMGDTTLALLTYAAGLVVDVVAFVGFLVGLPRLRMTFRRVIGPAVFGAIGLELLKTVGRVYIDHTASNPAYTVVASTVGLLLFLQLFDQLLLYCAALTACAKRGGGVLDRSADARPISGVPDDGRAVRAVAGHRREPAGAPRAESDAGPAGVPAAVVGGQAAPPDAATDPSPRAADGRAAAAGS